MRSYSVTAPIAVDHISPQDTYDFSSDSMISLQTVLSLGEVLCDVQLGKENVVTISGLQADTEKEAFQKASRILTQICVAITTLSEMRNSNPHYGQLRLRWQPRDVTISPRDHAISDSVNIASTKKLKLDSLEEVTETLLRGGDASVIADAYYRSLGPQDARTKYAVAFFVIELVERRCTKRITTNLLLPQDRVDEIIDIVESTLIGHDKVRSDVPGRVKGRLGFLKSATQETRAEKLTKILREVFEIREASTGVKSHTIEPSLAEALINARNDLFHGKEVEDSNAFHELALILVDIVGKVLDRVLSDETLIT